MSNEQMNEQLTPERPREMFHVLVRFKAPQEGRVSVFAEDQFQARRIVVEQFKGREDFQIIDVFAESQIKEEPEGLNLDAGVPSDNEVEETSVETGVR